MSHMPAFFLSKKEGHLVNHAIDKILAKAKRQKLSIQQDTLNRVRYYASFIIRYSGEINSYTEKQLLTEIKIDQRRIQLASTKAKEA